MVESSDFFGYETLGIFLMMALYILLAVYMPYYGITFIHVTGVAMLLGIGFGWIFYHVSSMQFSGPIDFDDQQFFYFILPPIVFAAGYNMKRKRFFSNIAVICLFGILGTLVCFITSSACSIFYGWMGWVITTGGETVDITVKESLLISSVMGSSDTVAILSIVSEVDTPKMFSIIFGESIVNDAVAIIMYQAALQVNFDTISGGKVGQWLLQILYQLVTSTLLGSFFGLLTAAITKHCSQLEGHAVFEIAFLFFMSMSGYVIALICSISGIITILITGAIMGHYCYYNLSPVARDSGRIAFQVLGEMVEDFVFIYLGLTTWKYLFTSLSIYYVLGMVFSILLGRVFSCFLLPLCWHVFRQFPLKLNELGMIWFGGSIRGCIAFGLILSVDTEHK